MILMITLGAFASLGTGNSMGICYFEAEGRDARAAVVWTTTGILLGTCVFLVILTVPWTDYASAILFGHPVHGYLIAIAVLTLGLQTVTEPFLAYLRLEERAKSFVTLSFVDALLTVVMTIVLIVGFDRGLRGMFEANLVAKASMLLVVLSTVARGLPLAFDRLLTKRLVYIGIPSVFGLFAFLTVDYADRLMLQHMVSLKEVGIYSVGYTFGMVMLVLVGAFAAAWPPYFLSFINRQEEAKEIFGDVLKYYVALFGSIALVFVAVAQPIVELITTPPYYTASSVVGLVAFAYMLKGCYLILLPGVYYAKKLHWQSLIEWVAAAANILLNFLLIPRLGMIGAAWATCLAYLSLPISAYIVSRRYLIVQYEWRRLGAIIVGLVVTALAMAALGSEMTPTARLMYSLPIILSCFVFLWFVTFKQAERSEIIGLVRGEVPR